MEQRVSLFSVRNLSLSILKTVCSRSIIAGEILAQSLSQLERDIHPVVIISAYNKALKEALEIIKRISIPIDIILQQLHEFSSVLCATLHFGGGGSGIVSVGSE